MPGTSPAQSQQIYFSQLSRQTQYHTQSNAFTFQPELNYWTKVLYKRGISTTETEREAKHIKESEHWLNPIATQLY
jgi:hypothetical protein